jgi:opacity protein-like surface antigen
MFLGVLALSLTTGSAAAQLGHYWMGIGVRGGWVTSYKNLSVERSIRNHINNFKLSGEMHDIGADFSSYAGLFGFDLSLDYAWKTQTVIAGTDLKFNTLALIGTANIILPLVISPFAGVGIGAFRISQSLSDDSAIIILPPDRTSFGWVLRAGLGLDMNSLPLFPLLEWRYANVRTPHHPVKYDSILLGLTLRIW